MKSQNQLNGPIPDLWEISCLPELKHYSLGGKPAGELIRETWHLAHDLQKLNVELLEACKLAKDYLETVDEREIDPSQPVYLHLQEIIAKAESTPQKH